MFEGIPSIHDLYFFNSFPAGPGCSSFALAYSTVTPIPQLSLFLDHLSLLFCMCLIECSQLSWKSTKFLENRINSTKSSHFFELSLFLQWNPHHLKRIWSMISQIPRTPDIPQKGGTNCGDKTDRFRLCQNFSSQTSKFSPCT